MSKKQSSSGRILEPILASIGLLFKLWGGMRRRDAGVREKFHTSFCIPDTVPYHCRIYQLFGADTAYSSILALQYLLHQGHRNHPQRVYDLNGLWPVHYGAGTYITELYPVSDQAEDIILYPKKWHLLPAMLSVSLPSRSRCWLLRHRAPSERQLPCGSPRKTRRCTISKLYTAVLS